MTKAYSFIFMTLQYQERHLHLNAYKQYNTVNFSFRGVPILVVSQFSWCPNFSGAYFGAYFPGVPIFVLSQVLRCPNFRGIPIFVLSQFSRYPNFCGVSIFVLS